MKEASAWATCTEGAGVVGLAAGAGGVAGVVAPPGGAGAGESAGTVGAATDTASWVAAALRPVAALAEAADGSGSAEGACACRAGCWAGRGIAGGKAAAGPDPSVDIAAAMGGAGRSVCAGAGPAGIGASEAAAGADIPSWGRDAAVGTIAEQRAVAGGGAATAAPLSERRLPEGLAGAVLAAVGFALVSCPVATMALGGGEVGGAAGRVGG